MAVIPRNPFTDETMLELAGALTPRPHGSLTREHQDELRALVPRGWEAGASCGSSDPEAWQPCDGGRPVRAARRVCAVCPVREACVASSLLYGEGGAWAGTSEKARKKAYRRIAEGVPAATVVKGLLDKARLAPRTKRKPPKTRPRQPCGTRAAYKRGCRCAECSAASRAYWATKRRGPRPMQPCGTLAAYRRGCRCDGCSAAKSAANRAHQARRKVAS